MAFSLKSPSLLGWGSEVHDFISRTFLSLIRSDNSRVNPVSYPLGMPTAGKVINHSGRL
jgi:hypothetical protein